MNENSPSDPQGEIPHRRVPLGPRRATPRGQQRYTEINGVPVIHDDIGLRPELLFGDQARFSH